VRVYQSLSLRFVI